MADKLGLELLGQICLFARRQAPGRRSSSHDLADARQTGGLARDSKSSLACGRPLDFRHRRRWKRDRRHRAIFIQLTLFFDKLLGLSNKIYHLPVFQDILNVIIIVVIIIMNFHVFHSNTAAVTTRKEYTTINLSS